MKTLLIFILCILLLLIEFTGCINQADNEIEIKKERDLLIIGICQDPAGFFPWMNNFDTNTLGINFNIFNPLVMFDNSFKLTPKLAKSWNNPDNCTWRFFLRDDVTFHNGYHFTAYDVKYTIDLIKDNKSNVLEDLITEVKEVRVVDNYTVDIVTYKSFPILLNELTTIPIASQKYCEETSEQWPIGTGAYRLEEYVPGDHITLVRFDNYSMGNPVIKKVMYKIIPNSEDLINALIAKNIDILEHVPQQYIEEILNSSGITIKKISNPTVWYLGFDFRENNSNRFPGMKNPLADVRVRKALYHAMNIDQFITIKNIDGEPASQFLSPLIFGYNPTIKRLSYDLNLSKKLLKDAGYEHGFNITIDCPENYVAQIEISNEIARQLSEIVNISVNLLPVTEDYYTRLFMGNFSVYILGWIPTTGDGGEIFDYLLRSENHPLGRGTYNVGYYSNRTIDDITSEISITMNQKARLQLMQEGFQIAMDDVACIPLYISICTYAFPDTLEWKPRADICTLVEEITVK